jgi:MFS transporter, ACS family, aldohexuronate transporter
LSIEPDRGAKRSWSAGRGGLAFLAIMFLGYAVYSADRTVLSSMLKPLSASLGLSNFEIGGLAAAQYIGVLSFVFLSGYLSDKYGARTVILAGVCVFTAFTWLIGISGDFVEAFFFRLVSGFGEGLFWPAAMSAVAQYFGMRKGLALGVFYAGFDLGGAAGNSLGSLAYSVTADWRTAFFVAPLVGVPVIAGVLLSKGTLAKAQSKVGRLALGKGAAVLLRKKQMVVLMVFALLATWASVWQVAYLPYYYSKVLGADVPTAGLIASAVLASGLLGKVTLGAKSDSWTRNRMLAVLSAALVLFYAVFFSASDFFLGLASALAMGFVGSAIFPVMQSLAADSSEGLTGTALGLTTTFQSVASVFATVITASLFALGVGRAIALDAMVPAGLMLVVALFLREPRKEGGAAGRS